MQHALLFFPTQHIYNTFLFYWQLKPLKIKTFSTISYKDCLYEKSCLDSLTIHKYLYC